MKYISEVYWYIYPCGYHWPSGYAKITLEATPRGLLWINNDTQEGMQVTGWPAKEAQSRVATGLRGWLSRNLHALAGGVIYSCMTTVSMLTRWVYSIYTSFNMLAELVAQIFPFVELVDLKLVLLCHCYFIFCTMWLLFVQGGYFLYRVVIFWTGGYFFVQVVIFWTGGYFSCAGGYFLDRWLFFVYRWLFFCTEGLCVYNGHSYFGYFAKMKYKAG